VCPSLHAVASPGVYNLPPLGWRLMSLATAAAQFQAEQQGEQLQARYQRLWVPASTVKPNLMNL
jgi:hypothetical protein